MSAHAQPKITPEQYLEIERAAEFRSEYYAGRMYAMAGGQYRHAHIFGNVAREIGIQTKGGPCIVTTSDARLAVSYEGLYTYPDVMVVCGDRKFVDGRKDTVQNPIVLVEVLSPSTEAYDRGFKAAQYRRLESLQEYAFVSQTEARVEVFRRQSQGEWLLSESIGLDAECRFDSIRCRIPLRDIYDRVSFEEEGAEGSPNPLA
jgi:Uma2 family endonuclease